MTAIIPFKPGTPADPEYFGGRANELQIFKQSLEYSLHGNPHHLAIMGERGIGKSSLLRKYEDMAKKSDCLVVRRELDATVDSIASFSMFLLEALRSDGASYASRTRRAVNKVKTFFANYKVGISVMGEGLSIEKLTRSVAIQDYLCNELIYIWNGIKNGTNGIVFLVDEAERLQGISGGWGFLRSVFTRMSEQNGAYMLVVSGKLGLFRGIKEIFSPMERFFTPIELMPMTLDEVKEILQKPFERFSRTINDEAVKVVFQYSGGHPYVVQTFGLYAFEEGGTKIDANLIKKILPRVMTRLSSQIFKDRFEQTSPQERKVLLAMSKLGEEAAPKQIKVASNIRKGVPTIINRLIEKDCAIKKERGKYSLFNPLFAEYVKGRMIE